MKRGFNSILNVKDRTHGSSSSSSNHSLVYNILLMGYLYKFQLIIPTTFHVLSVSLLLL